MPLDVLPIDAVLQDVSASLKDVPAVVIQAPPGAGKTTRVPVALDRAGIAGGRMIVVLQPRRVAARAAARRIASENSWQIGAEIGYQVRFDARRGPKTRILVVTEGIFLTMLQRDPFLEDIGIVLFDEFHERSISADLSLAMARRVQDQVRPDLCIVVMSATLDGGPVARFLGDCPIITCTAKAHPVAMTFLDRPFDGDPARAAAAGVRRVLPAIDGDVLVFLPGMAWIDRCARALDELAKTKNLTIMRLHSSLSAQEQDRALQRTEGAKIVLATNIAETSLTIDGVTTVVDSGQARIMRFDRGRSMNRLETVRISRASADQRAGRAGRQAPGLCLRLWTEGDDRGLRSHETPEISRLELSGPILQLLAWGESDPKGFPWFEEPPATAVDDALTLLRQLGALDQAGLTSCGRAMAAFPLSPRLARLLVEAQRHGGLSMAAAAAALLSEGSETGGESIDLASRAAEIDRLASGTSNRHRFGHVVRVRDQLVRLAGHHLEPGKTMEPSTRKNFAQAVLAAYPDRLARRRPGDPGRAVMAGGHGLRIDDRGELTGHEFLIAVEVTAGARGRHAEAALRQAVPVDLADLPDGSITSSVDVEFDPDRERVRAFARERWMDLVLAEHECPPPKADEVARILAEAAAADVTAALDLEREDVAALLARLRSLAGWRPELGLPDFTDAEIIELLPMLCMGKRSFAELRRVPLAKILLGALEHTQRQALAREAPERLPVPSGSKIRLGYEPGRPPVLAVRMQEVFGLTTTPTVAGGRVAVLLHLLAPNGRPQQITDDLASFWANAYPQVRAELRGRYPKHHWPEDPLTAEPTKRVRGRKRG